MINILAGLSLLVIASTTFITISVDHLLGKMAFIAAALTFGMGLHCMLKAFVKGA